MSSNFGHMVRQSPRRHRNEFVPHCALRAQRAGAIYADSGGSITVTEATLSSNWADWAVRSSQPAPALRDDFVTLVCARKGGAVTVRYEGYVNIRSSTLSSNSAGVRHSVTTKPAM